MLKHCNPFYLDMGNEMRMCNFECSIEGYKNPEGRENHEEDVFCCLEQGHDGLHQVRVNEEGF